MVDWARLAAGSAGPSRAGDAPATERGSITRLFGSRLYFRLWLAQFASSLGDWIGFVAITAISNRIAGTNGVALVLSARLVPGFFLGSVGGLLADRLDRKKLMVACDIGRGVVVGLLPFVHTLPLLFLINLVLEALTLLWTPAKEATVPNLVREEQLPKVNSLGLAAAYGTFPLGAGLFTLLAAVAAYLGRFDALSVLKVNQENLAIWTDTGTFLLSAFLISTLAIPRRDRQASTGKVDLGQGVRDVREGWRFIGQNTVVRSVMLALSCGLIGGGMVVPLGPDFARDVLGGGPRAFGALITAMGVGVAIGVIGVSSVQSHLRPERVFVQATLLAGGCLIGAASMWALTPTLLLVGLLGVGAGAVYVFGFSLVQTHTEDDLRGRIFSALYASVRLCLVLSFVLGPLLASLLGKISERMLDGEAGIGGWRVALPGSRLALWLAGAIILGAGLLARRSLRADALRTPQPPGSPRPDHTDPPRAAAPEEPAGSGSVGRLGPSVSDPEGPPGLSASGSEGPPGPSGSGSRGAPGPSASGSEGPPGPSVSGSGGPPGPSASAAEGSLGPSGSGSRGPRGPLASGSEGPLGPSASVSEGPLRRCVSGSEGQPGLSASRSGMSARVDVQQRADAEASDGRDVAEPSVPLWLSVSGFEAPIGLSPADADGREPSGSPAPRPVGPER